VKFPPFIVSFGVVERHDLSKYVVRPVVHSLHMAQSQQVIIAKLVSVLFRSALLNSMFCSSAQEYDERMGDLAAQVADLHQQLRFQVFARGPCRQLCNERLQVLLKATLCHTSCMSASLAGNCMLLVYKGFCMAKPPQALPPGTSLSVATAHITAGPYA